eukprot:125011-Prymnesium_polylepis.1
MTLRSVSRIGAMQPPTCSYGANAPSYESYSGQGQLHVRHRHARIGAPRAAHVPCLLLTVDILRAAALCRRDARKRIAVRECIDAATGRRREGDAAKDQLKWAQLTDQSMVAAIQRTELRERDKQQRANTCDSAWHVCKDTDRRAGCDAALDYRRHDLEVAPVDFDAWCAGAEKRYRLRDLSIARDRRHATVDPECATALGYGDLAAADVHCAAGLGCRIDQRRVEKHHRSATRAEDPAFPCHGAVHDCAIDDHDRAGDDRECTAFPRGGRIEDRAPAAKLHDTAPDEDPSAILLGRLVEQRAGVRHVEDRAR